MYKLLIVLILSLFFSCAVDNVKAEHDIYLKVYDASLILLVNGKENGSASFISEDGYVLTASHCIKYLDDKLQVDSPKLGKFSAKLIAVDKLHDVALLKANLEGQKAPYLKISKSKPLTPEKVYQMGSPIFRRGVLQTGYIARDDVYYEFYAESFNHYVEIIHVTASLQSGTSGGPWVNQNGELIGIQSGTLMVSSSPSGLSFMSPVSQFQKLIDSKQNSQSYNLDCKLMPLESVGEKTIARYKGHTAGLIVSDINESSMASKAGLQNWDLIVAINEVPVKTTAELVSQLQILKLKFVNLTVVKLDSEKSQQLSVPIEIVEDRLVFQYPPKPAE